MNAAHTTDKASRYPTKWKRTTMRGCGPGCQTLSVPVESRITGPATMETRHVDSHEPCPPSSPAGEADHG